MPPEVALRRKESARRRGLIAIVALVVLLVAGGVAASFWYAAQAEARLAAERQVTEQLLATQLEYSEVTQVRSQLERIRGVSERLGETEVLWRDVVTPYLNALTDDELVDAITVTGADPNGPALRLADPLRAPRIATITLSVLTDEVPEPHRWVRSWEQLDTFADASIDTILEDDGPYLTTVTINLDQAALSGRWVDGEDGS
jgi:hypothetical protein